MARYDRRLQIDGEGEASDFGLSSHQLVSAKDPHAPIRAVIAARQERFPGRPYALWRDDPELARMINEQLAAGIE